MEDSNGQERGGCPHIPALMQEENRLQLLASGVSSRLQRPAVERQKEGLGEEESCLKRGGEQSSQCVAQSARGSLLQPQATSGKHLFSSFVSSLLSRPICLLVFFFFWLLLILPLYLINSGNSSAMRQIAWIAWLPIKCPSSRNS